MRFKIDWASLILARKFIVFALVYFVFEGNFQVPAPRGLILFWRGNLTEGFLRYEFGGLIHGGAYFQNFTVSHHTYQRLHIPLQGSSNKEISPLGGNTPKINFPRS